MCMVSTASQSKATASIPLQKYEWWGAACSRSAAPGHPGCSQYPRNSGPRDANVTSDCNPLFQLGAGHSQGLSMLMSSPNHLSTRASHFCPLIPRARVSSGLDQTELVCTPFISYDEQYNERQSCFQQQQSQTLHTCKGKQQLLAQRLGSKQMMCLGNSTHCCTSGCGIFWGDEPLVVGCQRIFELPLPKVLCEGRPGLHAVASSACLVRYSSLEMHR